MEKEVGKKMKQIKWNQKKKESKKNWQQNQLKNVNNKKKPTLKIHFKHTNWRPSTIIIYRLLVRTIPPLANGFFSFSWKKNTKQRLSPKWYTHTAISIRDVGYKIKYSTRCGIWFNEKNGGDEDGKTNEMKKKI